MNGLLLGLSGEEYLAEETDLPVCPGCYRVIDRAGPDASRCPGCGEVFAPDQRPAGGAAAKTRKNKEVRAHDKHVHHQAA